MNTLSTKEWIAVVASVLIVGFFFVFGPRLLSLFQPSMDTQPHVITQDTVVGTGAEAKVGDMVTVHYTGRFTNGTVFDSSVTRGEPFQFTLGGGQVIAGWDQGIAGMKVGGTRILTIPPELGYGSQNYGPIPANSTLMFEVQLLKVN